jgi:Domain of unknown function (DUF1844)
MANEEEKSPSFKVNDRRRFSSEGELKPEFREGDEAVTEASGETIVGAAGTSTASADQVHPQGGTEHAGHPHAHPGHTHRAAESGGEAELTFGTFLVGLSTQALVLLGDIADPQSGKPAQDLRGAQQLIDIIGMLREKTRGNLDREEDQLIEAVLYELRMKYVERARQVPR